MTVTKYDEGLCIHVEDGKSFTLYSDGTLETTEFDEGGVYAEVGMKLPKWLYYAIQEAFEEKVSHELNKSA